MKPNEKARELVEKFLTQTSGWTKHTAYQRAKQCALIACDEILNALDIDAVEDEPYSAKIIIEKYAYWQSIKQSINDL
jgi:Mn-dependent DtxR family transcriptional regulator